MIDSSPQITCAVSRMGEYVVSPKTEVTTLTGRGRTTWHRTPSARPIRALKLTAVGPRRVRRLKVAGSCWFCTNWNRRVPFTLHPSPTKSVFLWFSGYYMYTEASRPRVQGDKARLLSPLFNVTSVRGPKGSGRVPYCVSFYYHMKGKHIGE